MGWFLDPSFTLIGQLKGLLFNAEPVIEKGEILKRFKSSGKLKLILAAGVFMNGENSRADLLVVGDHINKRSFDRAVKNLEAEIGKELNYGLFETEDFKYRLSVFDKFVRDMLDYPHIKVLDKLDM